MDYYMPEPNSGCWIWEGDTDKRNYPCLHVQKDFKRTVYRIHRVMCEQAHGPLGELHALHKCDNSLCINPDHLRPGTHQENMKEAADRNRTVRGEQSPHSVLDETKVREIRESRMTYAKLSKKYGVAVSCIQAVKQRRTWKHVA
jgi:hypothetical protein